MEMKASVSKHQPKVECALQNLSRAPGGVGKGPTTIDR